MDKDDQLIQAIKTGNRKAFRDFVLKHQDFIYSVCLSILKDSFEATEAAQDTFLKVHRSIDKFNGESKISSWMYRIAYRTSLDYLRKRKPVSELDSVSTLTMTDKSGSSDGIEESELKNELSAAIGKLDSDESAIVRMFYLEELTIKELAEITGLTDSNIKVKLYRARKKLFTIVNEEHSEIKSYL